MTIPNSSAGSATANSADSAAAASAPVAAPNIRPAGHGEQVARVTGGNKGIGLETARRLVEAGYCVYVTARSRDLGQPAADSLGAQFLQLDVTRDDSVAAAAAAAAVDKAEGHLDVLVNNAGVTGPLRDVHDYTADDAATVLMTNVVGYVRMVHAFLPLLERSTNPRIVNVSSGMGSFGLFHDEDRIETTAGTPIYGAAKAAINMFTARVARLLPEIQINAVDPGMTSTDLSGGRGIRCTTAPTRSWATPSPPRAARVAPTATATATCPGEPPRRLPPSRRPAALPPLTPPPTAPPQPAPHCWKSLARHDGHLSKGTSP